MLNVRTLFSGVLQPELCYRGLRMKIQMSLKVIVPEPFVIFAELTALYLAKTWLISEINADM